MKFFLYIISIAYCISFSSCTSTNKDSFAIRDFDKTLQPYLIEVVSKGIVGYDTATNYIKKYASDNQLKQLSQSEHPVLRALAFREMLERSTFNHFELIMNNLDDTAMIIRDEGEFGHHFVRVSDDLIQKGKWEDTIMRNKTIDALITKHNYLNSTYSVLLKVKTNDKYYPYIKDMATRSRDYDDEVGEMAFEEVENAIYALAAFKKIQDISIVKELLMENSWKMGFLSFELMKEFPNETYLDIFEKFYQRSFYRQICRDKNFGVAIYFINSIASYKNERSEKILSSILNKKPFLPCVDNSDFILINKSIKRELILAIWNNPCKAYVKIRGQIEKEARQFEENDKNNQIESPILNVDTSHTEINRPREKEPVRWWH